MEEERLRLEAEMIKEVKRQYIRDHLTPKSKSNFETVLTTKIKKTIDTDFENTRAKNGCRLVFI